MKWYAELPNMASKRPKWTARGSRPQTRLPSTLELVIDEIGARGDGVARHGETPVFVPFTTPGDKVVAKIDSRRGDGLAATLVSVVAPGPERVSPPCPYFGRCGGCSLQHWADGPYRAWKQGLLRQALRRAGLPEDALAPLTAIAPGTRRRVSFAFAKRGQKAHLGFNERASHRLIDIEGCLLLAPSLERLIGPLRTLIAGLSQDGEGDVVASCTETGIDLLIESRQSLDLFDRERLAAFAASQDLARLSWRSSANLPPEPLALLRPPLVRFADATVTLPPASFLQPSPEGERALQSLVFDALGDARRAADLFSGCGSFTFVLAQKADVLAVEGDEAALSALKAAAIGRRIRTERRDLARRPLAGAELAGLDAVVFDPPRAGAQAQAEALAEAGPPLVVAVSCNPATLARDGRILAMGGYRLERASAVDQFPWSAHLEAVAVFRR